MDTQTARGAEVFSLRTPYLSEGRSDTTLVQTDQLTMRIKVYAEGGENALHTHKEEDHVFVVLEGQATFYDAEGNPTVVDRHSGILQPAGNLYRFESTGDTNLVLLRAGSGKPQGSDDRRGPDGQELPGKSKANKRVPGVPVPGQFFGDG